MKKSSIMLYSKLLTICAVLSALFLSSGAPAHAGGESELPLFNTLGGYGVDHIVISPDGSQIFSYGMPNAELKNIGSSSTEQLDELTNQRITDAAFSPDGELLAVSINDSYIVGRAYIYNAHSGELVETISFPSDEQTVMSVGFTNDSKALIASTRFAITVIDIASQEDLLKTAGFAGSINHNSQTNEFAGIVPAGSSLGVQIRNDKNGEIIKAISDIFPKSISSSIFTDMEYSSDGKYFAVSYSDKTDNKTVVLDAKNNYAKLAELKTAGAISFSKNSKLMIVGNMVYPADNNFTSSYKIKNGSEDGDIDSFTTTLAPNDKYLIYVSDGEIKVLDASSLTVWLVSLSLEHQDLSLFINDLASLELVGTYSNGTKQTIESSKAKWSVADSRVAIISSPGNLRVKSSGKTTITADYAGLKATAQLTAAETPIKLAATLEGKKVKLEWSPVKNTTDLLGYKVYRTAIADDGKDDITTSLTDFAINKTTYVDETITSNQEYFYFIKAVYKGNNEVPASEKVFVHSAQKKIVLQVDSPYMTANGIRKGIDTGMGTAPLLYKGRVVLPIKSLITELGGTLELIDSKIIIKLHSTTIELWIDKNKATVNGVPTTLDVPPVVIKGRTMVPLRFVSENLHLQLNWDSSNQMITINDVPMSG